MRNSSKFWKFIVSGFGTGYIPLAPGTWGAGLAAFMGFHLNLLPALYTPIILAIAILVFYWLGVVGSELLAGELGDDPKTTVIDEMIGMWIALIGVPLSLPWVIAAFFLFRFFDIVKPFGIRKFETLKGGHGVMLDDVAAGVYANIVLQLALLFFIINKS